MTSEQHGKYLAYANLAFGGLYAFIMLSFLIFFGAMLVGFGNAGPGGPPVVFMILMWLFVAAIYGVMIVPSFLAGYGLLKNKKWAKTASIIAGIVAAMQFPLGTAVCVYTFWLLFSEPGKAIFEKSAYALPPIQQPWANDVYRRREQSEYTPPPTPPDWR